MDVMPSITIRYHELGQAALRDVVYEGGVVRPEADDRRLGLAIEHDGESWRVRVTPLLEAVIDEVGVMLPLPVSQADAVLLNGYESWTDTCERAPMDTMRGLSRAPRGVVRRYVLDGSGDYRFTRYDVRRGHQHGFGYGYLRRGDRTILVGSLDEDSGLTTIRTSAPDDFVTLDKEPPVAPVAVGETCELISFAVCEGSLDEVFDRWFSLSGVRCLPAPGLVGFTSWYRHYGDIDAAMLAHDLEGLARALDGVALGHAEAAFQIDDGYAKVGDWLAPSPERFPEGMAPLAAAARDRGFVPGIWLAPFVCERDSLLFSEHPEWLLRDAAGEPVSTGCNWSGAFALDTRKPEVRAWIAEVLGTVTRDWGFRLLKLDFLFAACMLPHDGMNRGELMADALDLVRASIPGDCRLLLCGVPLVSAFGRCEYCRVGCDVGLDWDDKPHMRLLHRERVSTKLSLGDTCARAMLDRRAFRCDPDVFFLRAGDVKLTPEQKSELLEADSTLGGVLFTSDDMGSWDSVSLEKYHGAVRTFVEREG